MTKSIVLEVCRECKVHPVEFFGKGRNRRIVRARRIAIHRMQHAGFSLTGIAAATKRSYSAVQYWVHPKYREMQREYYQRIRSEKRVSQ